MQQAPFFSTRIPSSFCPLRPCVFPLSVYSYPTSGAGALLARFGRTFPLRGHLLPPLPFFLAGTAKGRFSSLESRLDPGVFSPSRLKKSRARCPLLPFFLARRRSRRALGLNSPLPPPPLRYVAVKTPFLFLHGHPTSYSQKVQPFSSITQPLDSLSPRLGCISLTAPYRLPSVVRFPYPKEIHAFPEPNFFPETYPSLLAGLSVFLLLFRAGPSAIYIGSSFPSGPVT